LEDGKMKKTLIIFVLFSLIFPSNAISKTFYWKSLTTKERLISTENYFNPIKGIEIDPNDSNTLYLATLGRGLLKSDDGGKQFNPVNNGLTELNLNAVRISPDDSKKIYVGSATGLFVSYNSGESFSLLGDLRLSITSIEFGEDTIYAGVSNDRVNAGLYAYSGKKWVSVGLEDKDIYSIARLSPSSFLIGTSDGLYLFDKNSTSFKFLGFQGSMVNNVVVSSKKIVVLTNNGIFESDLDPIYFVDLASINTKLANGNFISACFYKDSPFRVVVGSDNGNLYRFDLEKKTFEQLSVKANIIYSINITNEGKIYVGSGNALFWSDNDCNSFKAYTLSLFGAYTYGELQVDPKNPDVVYVGSDNGLYKSSNKGMSFVHLGFQSERVFSVAINPDNNSELFVGTNLGLYQSTNAGESFKKLQYFSDSAVTKVVIVPKTNAIFASSDRGVFRSNDHGSTWESILPIKNGDFVLEIAPDPVNSDVMYVSTFLDGLYKTSNGGATWQYLGHEQLIITSISVCKASTNIIYLSSLGSIYLSKDGGKTLTKIFNVTGRTGGSYNFKQVVVNPNDPNTAFAVGEFVIYGKNPVTLQYEKVYVEPFLFMISNGGNTWTKLELPNTINSSNAIYYDVSNNTALILTGIGILRYDFNSMNFWFYSQGFPEQYVRVVRFFDNVLFVGTTSGIIGKSYNMGENFEFYAKFNVPILALYQDRSNPNIIYAGTSLGLLVSNNFGASWSRYFSGEVDAVTEVPYNGENVLLLGGDSGILKVDKDLKSYKVIYDGVCTALFYEDGVLYAGTDKGLLTSKDFENFEVLNNIESKIFNIGVFSGSLFVGTGSGLYMIKDKDVIPIISDLMILDMSFANEKMYLATDGGVLIVDKDLSYTVINNGLTVYYAHSIAFSKNGQPFLGTDGSGLYKLEETYEPTTFSIAASSGSGGSITPSGTVSVNEGESKTFTIKSNAGYRIKDVKVDGKSVGVVSTYTFTNVTSDHTIEAAFEKEITQTVIILQIGKSTFTANGHTRTLDSPPIIKNGRTLVPIRAIVEEIGGSIYWDGSERKVTIVLNDTTIELWIGNPQAKINGITKWIDDTNHNVMPEIINSRTMLPLRFVTESLGCEVGWDGMTKTITITYSGG